MYKLVVLSAFLALASAAPSGVHLEAIHGAPLLSKTITYSAEPLLTGYSSTILKPSLEVAHGPVLKTALVSEPSHVEVHEPVVAKVGEIVESVPSAVSHQSSTVIHSKANVVTPIVAPAVKSYTVPAVKTIATAPIVETYAHAPLLSTYSHGPLLKTYAQPLAYGYAAGAPILKSYAGPLTYSAHTVHGW